MGSIFSLVINTINLFLWPVKTCLNWCLEAYVYVVRLMTTVVLFFLLYPYRLFSRTSRDSQLQFKIANLQTQLDDVLANNRALQSKFDASEIDRWRSKEKLQKAIFQRNQLKDKLLESNEKVAVLEENLHKAAKEVRELKEALTEAKMKVLIISKCMENSGLEKTDPSTQNQNQNRSSKPVSDAPSSSAAAAESSISKNRTNNSASTKRRFGKKVDEQTHVTEGSFVQNLNDSGVKPSDVELQEKTLTSVLDSGLGSRSLISQLSFLILLGFMSYLCGIDFLNLKMSSKIVPSFSFSFALIFLWVIGREGHRWESFKIKIANLFSVLNMCMFGATVALFLRSHWGPSALGSFEFPKSFTQFRNFFSQQSID